MSLGVVVICLLVVAVATVHAYDFTHVVITWWRMRK